MQEVTYQDGRKTREFFHADSLDEKMKSATGNRRVKEVRAVKIGRNDLCPCGSGTKFKKCCARLVGAGPVEINGRLVR